MSDDIDLFVSIKSIVSSIICDARAYGRTNDIMTDNLLNEWNNNYTDQIMEEIKKSKQGRAIKKLIELKEILKEIEDEKKKWKD